MFKFFLLFFVIIFSSVACNDGLKCPGENCSGHGECKKSAQGDLYCDCDPGYIFINSNFACDYDNQSNDKPIIYLYPEKTTKVTVRFRKLPDFTVTYPEYGETGWEVIAHPDGTLCSPEDPEKCWYSLYWEGFTQDTLTIDTGFSVAGEDTADFLEEILPRIGLDYREAQEFIIYWLPILASNPYNIIHFATDSWNKAVPIEVVPAPDTIIRFLMIYQPSQKPENIMPQDIKTPNRIGFTLVEWGGRLQK